MDAQENFNIRNFLNSNQWKTLCLWQKEQDAAVAQQQREKNAAIDADTSLSATAKKYAKLPTLTDNEGRPYPYYGLDGAGYSYTFVPTSIGTVIVVKNVVTGNEVDLTEYDAW